MKMEPTLFLGSGGDVSASEEGYRITLPLFQKAGFHRAVSAYSHLTSRSPQNMLTGYREPIAQPSELSFIE